MLKTREILRLKHELGLSLREIGKACNCGKSTVSEVLDRAAKAKITWPTELNDKQLISLLYPPVESQNSPPEPDIEEIFYEMKKKSVTLMLLWDAERPGTLTRRAVVRGKTWHHGRKRMVVQEKLQDKKTSAWRFSHD